MYKKLAIVTTILLLSTNTLAQRCNGGVDCILLEQCAGLYSQLQRGANAQLTRLLRSLHCGFQGEDPMICCPHEFRYGIHNNLGGEATTNYPENIDRNYPQNNDSNRPDNNNSNYPLNNDSNRPDNNNSNYPSNNNNNPSNSDVGTNSRYPALDGGNTYPQSNTAGGNTRYPDRGTGGERVGDRNTGNLLPDNNVCGVQNNDRIVGGTQADIDEHPWMALLRYDKPYGWGFYCGGVLISSRYVMTAAHCVKGQDLPTNWRLSQVRLGEWNTSSTTDCVMDDCSGPVQDVAVEEIIAHKDYRPADSNQHNDIALLRLANHVQFNDFIKPICLPLSNDMKNSDFEGYTMEVAGWGKTESRSESDVKLKVAVPVVSREECSRVFSRVSREIINKQMCAGGKTGKDSCRGDSGGALMGRTSTSHNWFAAGVVSYGPSPCGTPGWPGVYTRVGAYIDWIQSKLRP